MMTGPAKGRRERATTLRALLACLALIALEDGPAQAQTLTPDLLRPVPGGFVSPRDLPLRKTGNNSSVDSTDSAIDPADDDGLRRQLRPVALFNAGVERIAVDMRNGQVEQFGVRDDARALACHASDRRCLIADHGETIATQCRHVSVPMADA